MENRFPWFGRDAAANGGVPAHSCVFHSRRDEQGEPPAAPRYPYGVGIAITLNLGPVVRERVGQGQRRLRLETEAATAGALIESLGVADWREDLMLVVNHHMVIDDATALRDGDEVGLYLPLEGG